MKTIKLKHLHNGEYIQFLHDTIAIVNTNSTVKQHLEEYFVPLSVQVLKLEKTFKIRGHALTAKIEEADAKRDNTFKGLKQVAKGYLNHPDAVQVDRAKQVMHLIEKYGTNVFNLNYQAETENLKMLVNALYALETSGGILTHLTLKPWVAKLSVFNEQFNALYLERNASYAEAGIQSVTVGREDADVYFTKTIELLEALILTKKAAHETDVIYFEDIRAKIRTLEGQYNDVVAMRKARTRTEEGEDSVIPDTEDTPTDE